MPFPLPLTPFEYYYWLDDRPEYPTTFVFELQFSGVLDRERFTRSLLAALSRHPLLTAAVDDTCPATPCWVERDRPEPVVDWADAGAPLGHPDGERIDLKKSIGVRVWGRQADAQVRVVFQVHHACCDGVGAARFIDDLLIHYSLLTGNCGAKTRLPPLNVDALRARTEFGIGLGRRRVTLRDAWQAARFWKGILLHRPAVLAAPDPSPSGEAAPRPFLGFVSQVLDPAVVRQLRRMAASRSATLNDVLLRDLFQVLHAWNSRHGRGDQNAWFRINMPTNLRRREDVSLPAANVLSFTFLSRKAKDCGNGAEMLETIREETKAIRQRRLGLYFVGGLAFARRVNWLLPWFLHQNRCFATAILTNMGRMPARTSLPRRQGRLICGDVILESIAGVPPLRPLTRAGFAVTSYAGALTLSLRCDPACVSMEDSRQLLAAYVAQLSETGNYRAT